MYPCIPVTLCTPLCISVSLYFSRCPCISKYQYISKYSCLSLYIPVYLYVLLFSVYYSTPVSLFILVSLLSIMYSYTPLCIPFHCISLYPCKSMYVFMYHNVSMYSLYLNIFLYLGATWARLPIWQLWYWSAAPEVKEAFSNKDEDLGVGFPSNRPGR